MTEKLAWKYIEEMGWGTKTVDYKALGIEWFTRLGKKRMKDLQNFVGDLVNDLDRAATKWEEFHDRKLDIGSDDGYSDVRYHVVGLGEKEFNRVVQNPHLLEMRYQERYSITGCGYKESFAYVFHEPDTEPKAVSKQNQKRTVKLRVSLDVEYSPNGVPIPDLQSAVRRSVFSAVELGLLAQENGAEMVGWDMKIGEIKPLKLHEI